MPPWILGWSVFTRPPSISGSPVSLETGFTATPPVFQGAGRAAGGEDLETHLIKTMGKFYEAFFIRNRNECPTFHVAIPPPKVILYSLHEQPVLDRMQPLRQGLSRIVRQNRDGFLGRPPAPRQPPRP